MPENADRIFYSDLSSEEGDKWAAKLQHQSLGVYTSTTTYAARRHIPSTYVIGTDDRISFQSEFIDMILDISNPGGGGKVRWRALPHDQPSKILGRCVTPSSGREVVVGW